VRISKATFRIGATLSLYAASCLYIVPYSTFFIGDVSKNWSKSADKMDIFNQCAKHSFEYAKKDIVRNPFRTAIKFLGRAK